MSPRRRNAPRQLDMSREGLPKALATCRVRRGPSASALKMDKPFQAI
ncbi:hypothetical protein JCM15519_03540 [Fundidesulfovibrio butyratiphilus]